ncbi:hypothetical protein AJ79_06646 [Helicocarpus griseus UAMH5409]|uniref:Uncharacterized protein n=1 Tax=Helicocarpus griseus UAMH5409 TaxID=1447875 RepID=A0A2B7XB81_9EURO|nr:hypothetical protein AJ79_06646 [Helicocarpus griseus UAMH5409]
MKYDDIRQIMAWLKEADIPVCIVGEFALNYYNVPRIIHDLELCLRAGDLKDATSIFESEETLIERADETEYNIYTEYKRGFPRFRYRFEHESCIVLFTDRYCHLEPFSRNIVSQQEHDRQDAKDAYSKGILDSMSAEQVATLPFPKFAPLFVGFCRTYIETQEVTAAIAAELLVDGMNIYEEWWRARFDASQSGLLNFALRLVEGKASRIADYTPNEVTCFVVDQKEAQRIRMIPGFS